MDIVEELRQDREAGAKRLESEYRAGLLAMARRLCSDLSDADELVNRTFAAVVACIDDYLEQSAFFGWMCRIMINLNSADRRRRSDRDVTYPGDLPETPDDAAHEAIYRDVDASILRDAINTLPKEMKEAIVMHYLMEQPVARIAKFLALPVSTVKWRIHCARVELTRRLTSSAKKPGVKAVLLALALTALTAVGAVGVAVIRSAADNFNAKSTENTEDFLTGLTGFTGLSEAGAPPQTTNREPPASAEATAGTRTPNHAATTTNFETNTEENDMNTQSVKSAAAKMLTAGAMLGVAPLAYGTDAGNFVWNGGFEESYIYWKNWSGSSNPYSLRYSEYGDINGIEARLEHWTGTGGIADKDASTAPKPNDTSLCSGERYLTIYRLQYVEQTLELPAAGTYEVSFRHCMRSGNSGHKIAVSLIDETETAVFSSGDVSPGNSAGTYTGTATIAAAGRYRLRFEGKVDAAAVTCIDDVAMALKDAASPFGAVELKLPRYDRALLKVRPLDYGQGDVLTQVDYRIAKHGQSFGPGWTAISAGLAKETEFAYLVTGLEIDTEYDLEVRFSAAGENFVAAKSFRTTKELLQNGGFEDTPEFLTVSAPLSMDATNCVSCWAGTGELANRANSVAGSMTVDATQAGALITNNVYAFIFKDKYLTQEIAVPTNGKYRVSYRYAATSRAYPRRDHGTAVEYITAGGVTNMLFEEWIEDPSDVTMHVCERDVQLPAGNLTFRMRGVPPDGLGDNGIATCYDDISLVLVQSGVTPAAACSVRDQAGDSVTLAIGLADTGAENAKADFAIAFAPTDQVLPEAYEPLLSEITEPGEYAITLAGLLPDITYAYRLRIRNTVGGILYLSGTFTTNSGAVDLIGNGGFEEDSQIFVYQTNGHYMDIYEKNGVWQATTGVWRVSADNNVYHHGLSEPNTKFTPNSSFTQGKYSGFIWKTGSFVQDLVVPFTGIYRLSMRYGSVNNYGSAAAFDVVVSVEQNGVTTNIWSASGVKGNTTLLVPDTATVELKKGTAVFTISQAPSTATTAAGAYDDVSLVLQELVLANELVIASQNQAVTGGMKPAPQVYADPAAGWMATFRAEPVWTDPATGRKYTCTGWKLYRNGALVDQKASLDCAYVHPAGADDRIVWGWKPWAPSDRILGGQGFFIRVF